MTLIKMIESKRSTNEIFDSYLYQLIQKSDLIFNFVIFNQLLAMLCC